CLSANYEKDNENENCHLNEAASYTNPESIKVTWGWWYYEMVRSYLKKPGETNRKKESCNNRCCQSAPCENNGTCHEICDVTARRYKCECLPAYTGHRCKKTIRSCHDVMLSGKHKNGVYQILNRTKNILYSREQLGPLCKATRSRKAKVIEDYAVEEEYPGNNWSSYRLSRANMESILYHSTQWRATCEFPTIGIDFKDYFCASLSSFDPCIHLLTLP
ncbi:hypothetical protein pdam_00000058, partial [Pocillopora damicornis]